MKKLIFTLVSIFFSIIGTIYADDSENPYLVYDSLKGLITVYTGDYSWGITIQDKNVGANEVGGSGLYFQRGVNNGNSLDGTTTNTLLKWNDNYNNKGYDGENNGFIVNLKTLSVWSDNKPHVNVWGGGGDFNEYGSSNWGYDIDSNLFTNIEGRKGPCDEGYHVPSLGEWNALLKLYFDSKNIRNYYRLDKGDNSFRGYTEINQLLDDLKIPLVGYRFSSGRTHDTGGYYRTSSPYNFKGEGDFYGIDISGVSEWYGVFISIDNQLISTAYDLSTNGYSVRCFKNSFVEYSSTKNFSTKNPSNDISKKEGSSEDEIVSSLNKKGITIHKDWESFKPDRDIRRDEAAKMIVLSIPYIANAKTKKDKSISCKFSDENNAWSDLKGIIVESCEKGLFKGYNGKFNPQSSITNGQLLTVVGRILYGMQDESRGHYANKYITLLRNDGYLEGLSLPQSKRDLPANRGFLAKILYKVINKNQK